MDSQTVNISLPKALLTKVDQAAKSEFASRSDYIRQALVSRLRASEHASWEAFETIANEIAASATEQRYIADSDFAKAVKDVRKTAQR